MTMVRTEDLRCLLLSEFRLSKGMQFCVVDVYGIQFLL